MTATINPDEAALFGRIAHDWWDPRGSSRLLHMANPARLGFIRSCVDAHFGIDSHALRPLAGRRALDVGCGAGLLAEPLARLGAAVTAVDGAPEVIEVARAHAAAADLGIDYRCMEVVLLQSEPQRFDVITCMEVLEHVDNVDAFLASLASLLAPGGILLLSTPNRTALSYAVLITAGEQLLRLVPRGAHDWNRFLTPDELRQALAQVGLRVEAMRGLSFDPRRGFHISDDLSVDYIASIVQA